MCIMSTYTPQCRTSYSRFAKSISTSTFISCVSSITTACGTFETIQPGETAIVQSPNFPNNYGNGEYCVWAIACPRSTRPLTVNITSFRTEAGVGSGCTKDHVIIRDGVSVNGTVLLHACGPTVAKREFQSSGPRLLITMFTNNNVTFKGFSADVSCPGKIPNAN